MYSQFQGRYKLVLVKVNVTSYVHGNVVILHFFKFNKFVKVGSSEKVSFHQLTD